MTTTAGQLPVEVQRYRTQRSKLQKLTSKSSIRFVSIAYCLKNWMTENIHSHIIANILNVNVMSKQFTIMMIKKNNNF